MLSMLGRGRKGCYCRRQGGGDLTFSRSFSVVSTLPVDQFFMSNAQPVLDMAGDDDMGALFPATKVGAPTSVHQRTETEDGLEGLFSRGRELANTLVRPEGNIDDMGIVAATEALKRHILSLFAVWHDRPMMLQVALGALAVFHLRPSPMEEVSVLW